MATYGYVRVSTAEQAADDRTSLDVQAKQIEALAVIARLTIDQMFTEPGISAAKPLLERPEGGRMWAMLQPGDALLVAKLDRLFRSAADALTMAERFKKRGVALYILDMGTEPVTESGSSRMFFGMLALVAEFERSRMIERVASGRAEKRKRGGHVAGARPFGWAIVGKGKSAMLKPIPLEQQAISTMREMAAGGASLRRISGELALAGVRISHMGVRRVLDRVGMDGN
jgi:DNA invertase Pin-like site-specific DNA recombinase